MNSSPLAPQDVAATVQTVVRDTPVFDIHTHLYAPQFDQLLLFGIDEMLTYHYLVAELFRFSDISYDTFWAMSKSEQAELIWQTLFIENTPISEACRGVVTTLNCLGLDAGEGLGSLRKYFASQKPDAWVSKCMEVAKVRRICMTNSPFDAWEKPVWDSGFAGDERFAAGLRVDPLLMQWETTCGWLREQGYETQLDGSGKTFEEVQKFLRQWAGRMGALYVMVSLPPDWAFPDSSMRGQLIEHAVVPFCRESGLPFALMMGVRREVNPQLKLAGDGVERSDLTPLKYLCAQYPDCKYLVTALSRENQHELCVLARKFGNLHPFGCWWFTNIPSVIDEMTRMRIELLGNSFTPQHSDARVMDQIIYKWDHSRSVIGRVLGEKYADLARAGWKVEKSHIERDVQLLFGGAFEKFLS